jgi:hypothetical protein
MPGSSETAIIAVNRGRAVSSRSIDASALGGALPARFTNALGTGSLTSAPGTSSLSLSLDEGAAAIFVAQ